MILKFVLLVVILRSTTAFFPLRSEISTRQHIVKPGRGCLFGDQYHEVGSSWHPNLGIPFGIMYCIRCHCVKQKVAGKSGQELANVACHDVRKDCPSVNCKGAKVQRGECCKTCPEDAVVEDNVSPMTKWDRLDAESKYLFDKTLNDEDGGIDIFSLKRYVALLTSPAKQQKSYLARATFTVHRGSLHFTVHHLKHSKPHLVQLLEEPNKILYTHETKSERSSGAIVCGVWRNLAKNSLKALDEGLLSLRLTLRSASVAIRNTTGDSAVFDSETTIEKEFATGPIQTHRALQAETFSSILTSNDGVNGGAIVMITLGRNFKNIDFAILYRDIAPTETRRRRNEQPIHITLELKNGQGETLRKSEKRTSESGDEFADTWSSNSDLLRALGRGSLHLTLEAQIGRRGPIERYTGNITTRATCDMIQAVISGSSCDPATTTGSVGSAVFHINPDNSISYEVDLSGVSSPVTSLQLRAFYRRRTRVITDLTAQYQSGKAAGILKEISAKELHVLLNNNAWITAATKNHPECEIQGSVAQLLYSGHLARYKGMPIPLYGSLVSPPVSTSAGGHAWLHLDEDCRLHYEIVVSGLNKDVDSSVAAHLHGLAEISGFELTHKKLLKGFYGTEARGILKEIPNEIYEIMNNGSAFVQVSTKRNPSGEIRGKVHIPNSCQATDTNPPFDFEEGVGAASLEHESVVHDAASFQRIVTAVEQLESDPNSCQFEGVWYQHNSEWNPIYDESCTTCICEYGNALCDPVPCPAVSCKRPVILDSECCPVCEDGLSSFMVKPEDDSYSTGSFFGMSNSRAQPGGYHNPFAEATAYLKPTGGCYQDGDPRLHPRGSSWNPIIHPFGTIACVTCTCHHNEQLTCRKVSCPATPCANPVRKNSDDCCKVCPEGSMSQFRLPSTRDGWMQDGGDKGMCSFGTELYAVGSSWNPKAHQLGKVECITCTCERDLEKGVARKCVRKCPAIPKDCVDIIRTIRDCCPKCGKRQDNNPTLFS